MEYLENSLMKDEMIIFRSKPHWIVFSSSLIWFFATFLILILIPKTLFTTNPIFLELSLIQIISLITFFVAVMIGMGAYIDYLSTDYVITSKRVLMKTGFLRRRIVELLLSRVESIIIEQSIMARLFNYGSIAFAGTNGGRNPFMRVPQPLIFRQIIEEQIETPVKSESFVQTSPAE